MSADAPSTTIKQSAPIRYLPDTSDVLAAMSHTAMLVRWRWRLIRNGRTRLLMLLGGLLAFSVLFISSSVGELIRWVAEVDAGRTAAGTVALNYLVAFERGDFGSIAALALGTAIAASIFSPLTGSANLALAAAEDLSILRLHRLHRFFDSFLLQMFSTIGALQLLSLTTVASLLTLNGEGRTYALLLTWTAWLGLVSLTVMEGWVIETVYRRWGTRLRFIIGAIIASIIGVAIWFDPNRGTTFFGVGVHYADLVQSQLAIPWWLPFAVIAMISVVFVVGGMMFCNMALNYAAVPVKEGKQRLSLGIGTSSNPRIALYQTILRQIVRTQTVIRPIFIILLLSIPAVWFTGGSREAMATLVLATPLAVALAFTSNAFGVIGPGMTWLLSLPTVAKRLPFIILTTSLGIIGLIFAVAWPLALAFGITDLASFTAAAAGIAVAGMMMTRSGLIKAIKKPYLARLGTRGDTVVPPLAAIGYTMRFALFSGQLGILTMSQSDPRVQWGLVLAFVGWTGLRYAMLMRTWRDRNRQAAITAIVAAG